MGITARMAALHCGLWISDRWYRLSWYVWPAAAALLVCGWVVIEKPIRTVVPQTPPVSPQSSQSKPVSPPPPVTTVVAGSMVALPGRTDWPEQLSTEVNSCFGNVMVFSSTAVEACTRLIGSGQADSSRLAKVYVQRGFHQRLTHPELALDDYNAALKLQANAPEALTHRAWIFLTRGQPDAALRDLNTALDIFPAGTIARGRALYYRGLVFLARKDYDGAMIDLNESLSLDRGNPDAYLARGKVAQAQKMFDAAIGDFGKYNAHLPYDFRGQIALIEVLEEAGRWREALIAVQRVLEKSPENPQARAARDRLQAGR